MRKLLAARRMNRSFSLAPVNPKTMLRILDDALRSPTAGNAQGVSFLALSDPQDRATYWERSTDEVWRSTSARFDGFSRAPFIVLALCDPAAYTQRYAESDKAASGLGEAPEVWPVPYWFGDAGMATMATAMVKPIGRALLTDECHEEAVFTSADLASAWLPSD